MTTTKTVEATAMMIAAMLEATSMDTSVLLVARLPPVFRRKYPAWVMRQRSRSDTIRVPMLTPHLEATASARLLALLRWAAPGTGFELRPAGEQSSLHVEFHSFDEEVGEAEFGWPGGGLTRLSLDEIEYLAHVPAASRIPSSE